jgi:hypothetical protein
MAEENYASTSMSSSSDASDRSPLRKGPVCCMWREGRASVVVETSMRFGRRGNERARTISYLRHGCSGEPWSAVPRAAPKAQAVREFSGHGHVLSVMPTRAKRFL